MSRFIVNVNKLNKRTSVPISLTDKSNLAGAVFKGFTFDGEKVLGINNPDLGDWYKDAQNNYYWGGGLKLLEDSLPINFPDQDSLITPLIKKKIEQIVNVFETSSILGKYHIIAKHQDYNDPISKTRIVQVTYGRSQTTEFGYLKDLIVDYVNQNGMFANVLKPYLSSIGKLPSLATNEIFCKALIDAGKTDPIMKRCQDELFDRKYFQVANQWFSKNGFTLPLSFLVIYDSQIHSGSILQFLRNRFSTLVPIKGGLEKEWITNYVDARQDWLQNHSNQILRNTVYRTNCFNQQIAANNWNLEQPVIANGIAVV
ncbi:chitosanase [Pedobacter agri]|uniref:chitosanase n=1 Tax=Pedobacter agri TaxID=454586 RepID=UPI00292CC7D1|nr:chitosanase [Pedobacter agri]